LVIQHSTTILIAVMALSRHTLWQLGDGLRLYEARKRTPMTFACIEVAGTLTRARCTVGAGLIGQEVASLADQRAGRRRSYLPQVSGSVRSVPGPACV